MRRVILGDTFRRIVKRGDWLWPRKNMPLSPGPHIDVGSGEAAAGARTPVVKGVAFKHAGGSRPKDDRGTRK